MLLGLELLLTGSKDWRQVLVVLREDLGLGEPLQPRACLVHFQVLGFLKFEEYDCFSSNNFKILCQFPNRPHGGKEGTNFFLTIKSFHLGVLVPFWPQESSRKLPTERLFDMDLLKYEKAIVRDVHSGVNFSLAQAP